MTVIAWDGKTLAADKLADAGCSWPITKIWRVRLDYGHVLIGGAGGASFILEMKNWIISGRDPALFPAAQRTEKDWVSVFVIEPDGRLLKYEFTPFPLLHEGPFYACGSGRDFAVGAMHMGADALRAVEIASLYDTGSGLGVDVLTLKGKA